MDLTVNYEEKTFQKMRQMIVDDVEQGLKRHHIKILTEIDVTKGRELIKQHREKTGEGPSFTGWIMKCIGQAVDEHKDVQALRRGKKIVVFDDVDISVVVERVIDGEVFPLVVVIRKANKKSFKEIHDEIRKAQAQTRADFLKSGETRRASMLLSLPGVLRDIFFLEEGQERPVFR